ncbi:hypothetical protein JK358_30295 [Nocardia sp. 2]|uniref:Uncharacterized protein n=1 Tax=Nocardia acididurans TaxID=2802282 RepID=A0ABS1MDQ8_9NOCA|nr:hypothetical protein [Nocardia acididurans]MBL1078701.1 hypothetical protein [Nocardia acididurans]
MANWQKPIRVGNPKAKYLSHDSDVIRVRVTLQGNVPDSWVEQLSDSIPYDVTRDSGVKASTSKFVVAYEIPQAEFETSIDAVDLGIDGANEWFDAVYLPQLEATAKRQAELDDRAKAKGKPINLVRTVRS